MLIADDYLTDFRFLDRRPQTHAIITGITDEPAIFCKTRAGKKIHRFDTVTGRTFCGLDAAQMVFVEEPIPRSAHCEWCRGAK